MSLLDPWDLVRGSLELRLSQLEIVLSLGYSDISECT